MKVIDFEHIVEEWAPRWIAWERDNVGLQIGDRNRRVRRVLVCLDVTPAVAKEAIRRKADLIVAHHPLFFRPPSSLTSSDSLGTVVLALARENIAVYAAHTNLDAATGGVSMELAKTLGLARPRILMPLTDLYTKIAVFVPASHTDLVMRAMADAGAGVIGNYSHCSFRVEGRGTFRGSEGTHPAIGRAETLEQTDEIRMEMIMPKAITPKVVRAMKTVHPYEEVAYDVYPLSNESPQYGMGAIGEVTSPLTLHSFLGRVRKRLKAEAVRYSGGSKTIIRTVAVCGGSGSDLLREAVKAGADAYVTADIRYHTFHEAEGRIALVDAGHWETEQVILPSLAERLQRAVRQRKENVSVFITKNRTNPIHSY